MSEKPEGRTKDSKESAEASIEEPEPLGRQDPAEPTRVPGSREGKGAT